MSKYRIEIKQLSDGRTIYRPQYRCLFLWQYYSALRTLGGHRLGVKTFHTIEDARDFINCIKNGKRKTITSYEYY